MSRLSMPYAEWPDIDQQLWELALFKGDILEPKGLAADWSYLTIKQDKKAYGLWLQHLEDIGRLDRNAKPGDRLTKDNLNSFTSGLEARVSSTTTASRLSTLGRMIRVLDLNADRSWLFELHRRYAKRARPSRSKHEKILHPSEVLKRLLKALDDEVLLLDQRSRRDLTLYRDLVLLVFLTTLPIRLNNIQNLQLGKSIIKLEGGFEVQLEASETKNSQPYAAPLPPQLTPYLDKYIENVRPILLGPSINSALWISNRYGQLSKQTIYFHTRDITKRILGVELTPHIFRDFAATYIATHHPDKVRSSAAVLGHRSLKTTQKHYNQANMLTALRQFQKAC